MKCPYCSNEFSLWNILSNGERFICPQCEQKLRLKGSLEISIFVAVFFIFAPGNFLLFLVVFLICYYFFLSIKADDEQGQ
jgi:DNA-directed RNA polymerase subunit RPC12/RpoP